jgi:hypothetical protein
VALEFFCTAYKRSPGMSAVAIIRSESKASLTENSTVEIQRNVSNVRSRLRGAPMEGRS